MKRRLLRLGLLMLAGAIVNVAVAWSCAYHIDQTWKQDPWRPTFGELRDRLALSHAQASPTDDWGSYRRFHGWGATVEDGIAYDMAKPARKFDFASARAGLPLHCLAGEAMRNENIHSRGLWLVHKPRWPLPRDRNIGQTLAAEHRLVPFRPLMWPFLVNTIFWAGSLWLLAAISHLRRRSVRMNRGWCPGCGYDLKGSPPDHHVCPECGGKI